MLFDEEKETQAGENESGSRKESDDMLEKSGKAEQERRSSTYAYRNTERTELWREPVYRQAESGNTVFSPSYHDAPQTVPGTPFPDLQPKREKKHREKKRGGFWRSFCLVLVSVALSSAISVGITASVLEERLEDEAEDEEESSVIVIGGDQGETSKQNSTSRTTGETIYDLACEQVVGLKTDMTTTNIFGQVTSSAVSGTGFVISADGYILTNYHVVEYAVESGTLSVMMYGDKTYDAQVIAYDEENDVAVVKIEAEDLTPVSFSYDLTVGETVFCVGNPLGELEYTMTSGIVSALDRNISTDSSVAIRMFQIDAAVNSGNSGGPVYNGSGKVVGMVTAKYGSDGVEGLGFAIPIQDAVGIATDLIEYGYVSGRAYLGVNGETVSSSMAQYYQLPAGVYITNVYSGSAAESAGVKVGDVMTSLDGTEITSLSQLKSALQEYEAGDAFTLTVYRSGETITLSGVMAEETPETSKTEQEETQQEQQSTITMPDIFRYFPWG